jgi:hypothetical protein
MMFSLSYNGQMTIDTNTVSRAHELLDDLFAVDTDSSPVNVEMGQIRFQESGALLIVSLRAKSDISTLKSVQADLADSLVSLGVEQDINTATEQITVTKS